MRKKIKRWGDSFVIVLSPEDCEGYSLREGTIVDIQVKKVIMESDLEFKTADQLMKTKKR